MARKYISPGEENKNSLPLMDHKDLESMGWEVFVAYDGDLILQHWCSNCDEAAWIKLPPGAIILHGANQQHMVNGVTFGGKAKEAPEEPKMRDKDA